MAVPKSPLLRKAYRLIGEARSRLYDWQHDVQTGGYVPLDGLNLVGTSVQGAEPYTPSHPKFLFSVLGNLEIDYSRFHFVDLGSGKGRVLLVASEFPFRHITGVEFATELRVIAQDNVARYKSATQRCRDIVCLNQDAAEYVFPPEPTVIFMAHPLGLAVFTSVTRNLQASLDRHPRDVVLLYEHALCGDLVEQATTLRCTARGPYHNAYANFDVRRPADARASAAS